MVKIGIIGGSGLDNPDILKEARDITVSTPFGPPSSALKSGNISGALWFNEREIKEGVKVGFKTVTLRRSWKDKKE